MKKNRLFMLGLVTVFVAVLSLTLVSSTFARYTSTITGGDTAKVAKWDVKVNGSSTNIASNLWDTIVDTTDGNPDDHVTADRVAPGTKGSYQLTLTNDSEVAVNYTMNITEVLNGVPVNFVYKIGDAAQTVTDGKLTGTLTMGDSVTYVVSWEWPFGESTLDNAHSGKDLSVNYEIVFDQID